MTRNKQQKRRRLGMESLEARLALATGVVSSGNLTITDTSAVSLFVEQTAANEWTVSDAGGEIANSPFTGVTGNVIIRTGAGTDAIDVDLGGLTAPKSLSIQAGGGDNTINIHNGTIKLLLDVRTFGGADEVTIDGVTVQNTTILNVGHGDNDVTITDSTFMRRVAILTGSGIDDIILGGAAAVDFNGSLVILDYGGSPDTLVVNSGVTVASSLSIDNINDVQILDGAEIHGSFFYSGGFAVENDVTIDGEIDGTLWFYGNSGVDTLTLSATSNVGSVQAWLRGNNDIANFDGTIAKVLGVDGQVGNDTISFTGSVGLRATILGGLSNDTIEVNGSVGVSPSTASRLTIDGGSGDDDVAVRDGASIAGQLTVTMGAGNDRFYLAPAPDATLASGSINGGTGTDEYYGNRPRTSVIDKFFEVFGLVPPF